MSEQERVPTGAELRARREALGMSVEDVARLTGMGLDDVRSMEACGCLERQLAEGWTLYAAALDAEESRLAAEPFKVGDWVRVKISGVVYRVGEVARPFAPSDQNAYYRETPGSGDGQSWAASALERADPPEPEAPAEPVPPEGVTTRVIDGWSATKVGCAPQRSGCTYVSINRGCHEDLIATVWHSDALAISIEDEYASPEALEYVAALSRHIAAQHAADDRARKLDAVRVAEEAWEAGVAALGELTLALEAARDEARKVGAQ